MSILQTLGTFVQRRLQTVTGALPDRRYSHRLHRGGVDEETLRRARASWWGDDPRWYPGGTPPRRHNRVAHLIDGDAYFSALCEALTGAEHYVFIIGWCLTPYIPLLRGDDETVAASRLLSVLAETARRVPVRILIWSGAPFLLEPTTSTTRAAQQELEQHIDGDLQCRLDDSARFTHCHHQKAVVVDGRVAFVGGMDLTTFQGDRWDVPGHPLRAGPNWHDVQVRIEGEAVADVEHNFRQRWCAVTDQSDDALPHQDPMHDPSWDTRVQIVRTIPKHVYSFARHGEFGIHHAYTRALRRARRLIYLENQYLWAPTVMEALLTAMNRKRSEPFRIVLVLPARAYSGKWDNDQHVKRLREEDNGRGIVSIYCPYASGATAGLTPFTYRPTYVHAKVAVIDDEWFTVGSANLNGRGLITDSEINAVVRDASLARDLRIDLWAEHLDLPREQVARADPIELVDKVWTARSARTAATIQSGDAPLNCGVHRYEIGRMPGAWLLEEAEALTLEH